MHVLISTAEEVDLGWGRARLFRSLIITLMVEYSLTGGKLNYTTAFASPSWGAPFSPHVGI